MFLVRHEVTITTDASGDGTGYIPDVCGRILSIQYVKVDYADGVDFAITGAVTGTPILSLTDQNTAGLWYPRQQVHDGAGGSALTLDGSNKNVDAVGIINERIKIVVAQGGNAKSGTFRITVG